MLYIYIHFMVVSILMQQRQSKESQIFKPLNQCLHQIFGTLRLMHSTRAGKIKSTPAAQLFHGRISKNQEKIKEKFFTRAFLTKYNEKEKTVARWILKAPQPLPIQMPQEETEVVNNFPEQCMWLEAMDCDPFSTSLFKWDARAPLLAPNRLLQTVTPPPPQPPAPLPRLASYPLKPGELGGMEEMFQAYGIRYHTAAKLSELGFTASTLLCMRDEELDEMMYSLHQIFRWDLLVGERYGIKAAVRAERRRLLSVSVDAAQAPAALPREGFPRGTAQQEEAAGSAERAWGIAPAGGRKQQIKKKNNTGRSRTSFMEEAADDDEDRTEAVAADGSGGSGRQREHPFVVTEPGEVARGKKNGLDFLFHLYELCREFLIQVQNIAKERGEKCPTKVTNQVFRYAKAAGATYINKPKMRHYVHCYALHCLDEAASNALRRAFKESGENVGAWRQACFKPLVGIAATQGWDIDAVFDAHPGLSIWYVPAKLRQLCHAERSGTAASSSVAGSEADRSAF